MGLIRTAISTIHGEIRDQFLASIEPDMDDQTVFARGIVRNKKGLDSGSRVVPDGSMIHVYDNQFMMLVDGGKIIDYSAEPGYFQVDNSSQPSLFNGQFKETLKDTWERFKFNGTTPKHQEVFYINLQEIRGIRFGTRNPINYFDQFYNAELFLRAHGTYSVKISNPLLFYQQVVAKNADRVAINDINEQLLDEFLEALQTSINQMSADGIRISYVASKGRELAGYMADTLDDSWKALRGVEIVSVAIASISYDEESQKLINMRNQGAMMSDASIREGYVQSAVAKGIQDAGSNANGAAAGFMGVGMGMNTAGGFMSAASASNTQQMQMQQQARAEGKSADSWTCSCGAVNTGKFCANCGKPKPEDNRWTCSCGTVNTGKFCTSCGKAKPQSGEWTCSCGTVNTGRFCSNCGKPRS